MICPECGGLDMYTTDTRRTTIHGHTSVRRRRHCRNCPAKWTTYELSVQQIASIGPDATKNTLARIRAVFAGAGITPAPTVLERVRKVLKCQHVDRR